MKAFITGIDGFVGKHLAQYLLEQGITVSGIGITDASRIDIPCIYEVCDITDAEHLQDCIERTEPDVVYHLAAIAFVPDAEKSPERAIDVNITGSVNVLECVSRSFPAAKCIMISTGEVYGIVSSQDLPLEEDTVLKPANLYAATKMSMETFAQFYAARRGAQTIILRPFNHIGPGQSPLFVTSDFARQIALIEKGEKVPVMSVGNLEAARDFTDVRDVVRAYHLAAQHGVPGEVYNIASDKAYIISEILEILISYARKSITVTIDENKFRHSEIPVLKGDYSKLSRRSGWKPTIPIESSLKDILNYWREQV